MLDIILGIVLLVAAVFLVVAILFQSSKSHRLSGTIAGGAETFFGKTKGNALDRVLGKVTAIVAIVFCVAVVVMYVAQDQQDLSSLVSGSDTTDSTDLNDIGGDGVELERDDAEGTGDADAEGTGDADAEGAGDADAEGEDTSDEAAE